MAIRYFFKSLFLGLLFMSFVKSDLTESNNKLSSHMIREINKENTVIAFDLHEVIFEKVHFEMALHILKATIKGFIFYLLNPFFLYDVRKLSSETIIWEDFFSKLKALYPSLSRFDTEFYAVANAQKPVKEMVDLISILHNKGYKLYVLSNIGGETFELFKKKFPELFKYFSGSYTPDKYNSYICKPNILFYTNFKKYVIQNNNDVKYCFFIDDLEPNIKSANDSNNPANLDLELYSNNCHICGIKYTDINSLKKDLLSYGIL